MKSVYSQVCDKVNTQDLILFLRRVHPRETRRRKLRSNPYRRHLILASAVFRQSKRTLSKLRRSPLAKRKVPAERSIIPSPQLHRKIQPRAPRTARSAADRRTRAIHLAVQGLHRLLHIRRCPRFFVLEVALSILLIRHMRRRGLGMTPRSAMARRPGVAATRHQSRGEAPGSEGAAMVFPPPVLVVRGRRLQPRVYRRPLYLVVFPSGPGEPPPAYTFEVSLQPDCPEPEETAL